jgi:hypothetical protein
LPGGPDDVDAGDFDFAAPERIDAAGEDDFLHRGEVRIHAAGRIRNADVAQDDSLRTGADDFDLADRHLASEPVAERVLDAQFHQAGEARAAEVPVAAADGQEEETDEDERADEDGAQTTPHRAFSLALARRAVMAFMMLGRARRIRHSANSGAC